MQSEDQSSCVSDARAPAAVRVLAAIYVTLACVLLVKLAVNDLLCPEDVLKCSMRVQPWDILGPIFAAIICAMLTCSIGAVFGSRGARRWLTIVGAVMALGWTASHLVMDGGLIGLLVPATWMVAHGWCFFGGEAPDYFVKTRTSLPRA